MHDSMHQLTVPNRPELLGALGRLAIAHTHLELILKYCVKTIAKQSVEEALDATEGNRISDLPIKIKQLFKERKPTALEKNSLDALLGCARRLSKKRNSYLHRAWSETPEGLTVMKGEHYQWGPAPSDAEIEGVTSEIVALGERLNHERRHGFIQEVMQRQPPNPQVTT